MIEPAVITLASKKLELFSKGLLAGVEVDEVVGIEEGPEMGDEIKIYEATFNNQTFLYDEMDQKTIVGKVSEHNTVLHIARCNEGYHVFFATYDETVDLFGDYIFLGLIPNTKPSFLVETASAEYLKSLFKLVVKFLFKDLL